MSYEQIRSIFTENAWFGFNMDYGLLHLQLATPIFVLFILLSMILLLNQLLFKPVLKTIDHRKNTLQKNQTSIQVLEKELQKVSEDLQSQKNLNREKVAQIYHAAQHSAKEASAAILRDSQRENKQLLEQAQSEIESEFQLALQALQDEIQPLKQTLQKRVAC